MTRLIPMLLTLLVTTALAETRPLEVIRKIPHSGYSEGLDWKDGYLWHTLPQETLKIDPADGSIVERFAPASPYNESPLWVGKKLVIFSYHDNGIYSAPLGAADMTFVRVGNVPEKTAWGSTYDGKHVIITGDYSKKLYFLDPKTYAVTRTLETEVKDLEDLAWDGTGIWASSFTQHRSCIFRINPKTGAIGTLWKLPQPDECPVVDGLAYDGKTLWVTGKNCPSIYNVKMPKEPKK